MSSEKVEIAKAKSGHDVLMIDGKASASLVDPVKEAKAWSETVASSIPRGEERLIVLGVGSGFHIRALREALPRISILAIDTCEASVDFASKMSLPAVQFQFVSKEKLSVGPGYFMTQTEVRDWILEPFSLIRHRSTMARNKDLLRIEDWIIGRSAESLREHLGLRPSLAALLNAKRLQEVALLKINAVDVFSMRDFVGCCDIKSDPSHERRLFRVLEELVR
jgi:hypothetical protein